MDFTLILEGIAVVVGESVDLSTGGGESERQNQELGHLIAFERGVCAIRRITTPEADAGGGDCFDVLLEQVPGNV